jgi:hypothetical protein
MTELVQYAGDDGELAVSLAQQQQLMVQILQGAAAIQGQLKRRLDVHEQRLDEVRSATAALASRTRQLEMASKLITTNMLDTMLTAGWSELEKKNIGIKLGKFSREHYVVPAKIPHPTITGGVNGYLPSVVKAWIEEETDYDLPLDLRYVE